MNEVPKDEWVHFMVTYDGSSKASGLKVFQNGVLLETEVENDNLYKDILLFDKDDNGNPTSKEPGLQVGAWWRGVGIRGARVDDVIVYDRELSQLDVLKIADSSAADVIVAKSPSDLTKTDRALLQEHFVLNRSDAVLKSTKELKEVRSTLYDTIEQVKEIMVMKEMENPRKAYVLNRGLYDSYGEEVFPDVPEAILPWTEDLPKNRLGLAHWLTDPDHPLTARVAVNRYWQNYFGRGLVRTTEDFGNQGEMPSHLELLDWLALEFIDSNWDVKALQKLIVMSATYRQSSKTDPDLFNRDPDNVLLARGPTVRLSSEMIRDNALAASGLLNKKIGGESIRPYQPEGLWSMNTGRYVRDTGDKLYRRSLYAIWKRTVPNPTLYTFDQPDREVCTVRRQKTNTPLQALVLLNDPTFLEAAKVIGETMASSGASEESIASAFRRITGTEVEEEQLKVLASLQKSEYEIFKTDKLKKKGWIESGDYKIDPRLDADLVAANAVVASVILNSDACITKR